MFIIIIIKYKESFYIDTNISEMLSKSISKFTRLKRETGKGGEGKAN